MSTSNRPAFDLRRLEEVSQNASRPDRGLMVDGWSVGLSQGVAKRSRCINAFYRSQRPFAQNLVDAKAAYAAARLPCVFRMTPFIDDQSLDSRLDSLGYVRFDPAIVMALDLDHLHREHVSVASSQTTVVTESKMALAAERVAALRGDSAEETTGLAARWQLAAAEVAPGFVLTAGAGVNAEPDCVASSVTIREGDHVGVFDVVTAADWRGRGLASVLIATQLADARARGAQVAYLHVRADNPARRIYERFGFVAVYEYWYRALPGDAR
jgi:ribosomal protein S18 acetylase RimI-like enzyme